MAKRKKGSTSLSGHEGFCATQKGHTGSFTPDQIKNAAEAATIKGKEVRARLKELLVNNG